MNLSGPCLIADRSEIKSACEPTGTLGTYVEDLVILLEGRLLPLGSLMCA